MNNIEAETVARVLAEVRAAASPEVAAAIINRHDGWVGKAVAIELANLLTPIEREVRFWGGTWHTNGGPCGPMLRIAGHLGHERGNRGSE